MHLENSKRNCAIVLAGALGQGAFDAGALKYLIGHLGLRPRVLVGTSSGALNAMAIAAGLVVGEPEDAAAALCRAWDREASAWKLLRSSLSPQGILQRRGILNQNHIDSLLRRHVVSTCEPAQEVDLRIPVAVLEGRPVEIDGQTFLTAEHVERFSARDFAPDGLERVLRAAAASAAFPGLFVPVTLPELGDAVDGGAVDNAPLSALPDDLHCVYLVSADAAHRPRGPLRGAALAEQMINILIRERLIRDRLSLQGRLKVIDVRPDVPLVGNALGALAVRRWRRAYIQAGYQAAAKACS